MLLGTQIAARDDDDYRMMAQLGVTHVCADPPGNPHGWSVDDLARHRDKLADIGLTLEMVQLPLSSHPIEKSQSPDILLAGPERDAQISSICRLIERLGEVGLPSAKYNLNIIGIPRSEPEPGRGGSRNSTFRWEKMQQDAPPGAAGVLDEEENWARIAYFLDAVVPVAESARVRLACHPHDPYTPPGYRGVTRVLGTVEGLKRFVQMSENPWHGLNFCQGSVGEMLDDPGNGDLRGDPLVRRAWQDLQRALPQHPGRQAELHGGVSGRGRHGHGRLDAALRRARLPLHADARPRAQDLGT